VSGVWRSGSEVRVSMTGFLVRVSGFEEHPVQHRWEPACVLGV